MYRKNQLVRKRAGEQLPLPLEGFMSKDQEYINRWHEVCNLPKLLVSLGEDLGREGLQDTPKRIHKAWSEMLVGYKTDPATIIKRQFGDEGGGVLILNDIEFTSICEHHLLPFFGTVSIAYIPTATTYENHRAVKGGVCGLSKLARLVDCFTKRLQIQERIVNELADCIFNGLQPEYVYIGLKSKHMCCIARGVRQPTMNFSSIAERGKLTARCQFLLNSKLGI